MNEQLIDLQHIADNPYQPRTTDDPEHIEKLARSIAADDLLQAPRARKLEHNGSVQLAFGHSRRRAFEWLQKNWSAQGLTDRYDGYGCMPVEIVELTDEQMYRQAVTENVQRKDLAPTELAKSMKQYMDEFGANSKAAGDLFGMSDATVRGMVRLLELPAPVQEKLDDGTISQGTARTLLSMQKIAPETVIVETLQRIERNPGSLPEDVIENSIERMDEVVDMWSDNRRDGKPRSSFRNGWPLDMKNFPNKLLPVLTPVDAAIALGIQDSQSALATVGTWLDEEIENRGHTTDNADYSFLEGRLSSDQIERLKHLLNPPACTACPFYTKVRGSHYCGMKTCHTRKTAAWKINTLQQASKNLGIEIYQKSDGAHRTLSSEDSKLFEKRHAGLRLIPADQVSYSWGQYGFKGVETDIFVVVATGDAIEKLKGDRAQKGGKKTTAEIVKMRQMKVYRPHRRQLIWEFALGTKHLFDGLTYPMLKALDHGLGYLQQELLPSKEVMVAENAKVDAEKADYYRCKIIWRMAVENSWQEVNNVTSFITILKRLEKLAQDWGVDVPKDLGVMAAQFQLELTDIAESTKAKKADEARAAAGSVSTETPRKKGKK